MFEIQLHQKFIDDKTIETINGRDIHADLGVGRKYADWVKEQIEFHQFIENIDFIRFTNSGSEGRGGHNRVDYFFTIDAAKHIALTSRTEKGRLYRQALINLEKEVERNRMAIARTQMGEAIIIVEGWTRLAELFEAPKHLALIEASKQVKLLGIDTTPLLQSSSVMDDIRSSEIMLEPTAMASVLGFKSGIEMNKVLERVGLQSRIGGQWVATDMADGMYFKHAWEKGGKSGYNYKWNVSKVEELLSHMLSESE